ncbi:hypothetical protein EDB86DRAFT_1218283 [Lactarius hatsudake]|nr:hypothetical protein EDB86DRAFT_1218283 [Lactarius hatsudake]
MYHPPTLFLLRWLFLCTLLLLPLSFLDPDTYPDDAYRRSVRALVGLIHHLRRTIRGSHAFRSGLSEQHDCTYPVRLQ